MARPSYIRRDDVRFVLINTLRWIFIVLAHWNDS